MTGDKHYIVFVISYKPQDFTGISKLDHRRPRGMKWVLANKQICQEAIEQFHRQATWTVLDTTFRGTSGRTSPWSQPHHPHHTSFQPRPFVPMSARHIVVHDPIAVVPRPEGEFGGKPEWHLQTDWHFIDRFVTGLCDMTELQVLSIALYTAIYSMQNEALEQAPEDVSIKISMGMLNVFKAPNLQKLEFKVNYTAEFEARQDFLLAWEKYLDGIGAILIGGKIVKTSHDIETSPRKTVYTYTRS